MAQYLVDNGSAYPYLEILDFGTNKRNDGGILIKNAIFVQYKGIYTEWKDLDDMLENNRETKASGKPPVYYVKVED